MRATTTGYNPEFDEDAPAFEDVSGVKGFALLEFGAPWCGHCQAAAPAVEEAMSAHPSLQHIKVYDGKGKRLGRAFSVKLWPTLVLLEDGLEIERLVRPIHADEVTDLLSYVNRNPN